MCDIFHLILLCTNVVVVLMKCHALCSLREDTLGTRYVKITFHSHPIIVSINVSKGLEFKLFRRFNVQISVKRAFIWES